MIELSVLKVAPTLPIMILFSVLLTGPELESFGLKFYMLDL